MSDRKSSRTKREVGSTVTEEIRERVVQNQGSQPFSNPITQFVVLSMLLVVVLAIPLSTPTLIGTAFDSFYSIDPVLGSLATLATIGGVTLMSVVAVGGRLGYNCSYRGVLHRTFDPTDSMLPAAGVFAALGTDLESLPAAGGRLATPTTDDDALLLPLSAPYRDEMRDVDVPSRRGEWAPLGRNHSTMALGEVGAGKAATVAFLLCQMDTSPDEPVVVFDDEGEFGEGVADATVAGATQETLVGPGDGESPSVFSRRSAPLSSSTNRKHQGSVSAALNRRHRTTVRTAPSVSSRPVRQSVGRRADSLTAGPSPTSTSPTARRPDTPVTDHRTTDAHRGPAHRHRTAHHHHQHQ
jgi:hypothetical protein